MFLRTQLFEAIFQARQRVYAAGQPTPLEPLALPGIGAEVWIKREDLSPIHAYKWRGAHNRIACLTEDERERGVVTASAGNHAQGVALAAARLGVSAAIVMPVPTPAVKRAAVERHGRGGARVVLHGDTLAEALAEAKRIEEEEGRVFVPPFDDLQVMGGQGTLADEIVMSGHGPFDAAYLQIGGGGMAAAVACWLKSYWPEIRVIGVEAEGQDSMRRAVEAGAPVAMKDIDIFCDGTAVSQAGELTLPLCQELVDEFVTVSNDAVCAAIQTLWETRRCVVEPSGALGLAGLMQHPQAAEGKRALTVLCGANMDFTRLAWIARHAPLGSARRRHYRIGIAERKGSLLEFLETHLGDLNIVEFQYGKTDPERATYVIGVEATPPAFDLLERRWREGGVPFAEVTGQSDVEFRVIRYRPDLFHLPLFVRLEFAERAGALHDFLAEAAGQASICYFSYLYSGEQVGRALIGLEFESEASRTAFSRWLDETGPRHTQVRPEAVARMLGDES